jgi:soluble lytic murein transglycosylase-like protein
MRERVAQKLDASISNLVSQYELVSQRPVRRPLVQQDKVSDERVAVLATEIERCAGFMKLQTDAEVEQLLGRVVESYLLIMMDPKKAAAADRLNATANDNRVFARWLAYREIIREAAADPRVRRRPNLLAGLGTQESRLFARAVSRANAKGIMQLMDETAAVLGVDDPFDPAQSMFGGAVHLSNEIRGAGTLKGGLMRYNVGGSRYAEFTDDPAGVLLPAETRSFPDLVLEFARLYDIIDPEGRQVPPRPKGGGENGFAKSFQAKQAPSAAQFVSLPGDSARFRTQQAVADCMRQFFLAQK